jgi:hypothetical protein
VLTTIDPAQLNGSTLAIDASALYFTTTAGAMRLPLAGGAPILVAAGMHGPLVLDASTVYGFDATGIVSAPKSGGTPTSVRAGTQLGQHLAIDATRLYFHDYYGVRANGDNYHQSIFALTLATGAVINLVTNQFVTSRFVDDGANLYWFSDNCPPGHLQLMSVAKTGGSATTLLTSTESADGPVFDGSALFWTRSGGCATPPPAPALRMLPIGAVTPTELAVALDQPGDLAVDGSSVYFTVHYDTIAKVAKSGGTPTALASKLMRPTALVLDDASLYWINAGDGSIVKTSK